MQVIASQQEMKNLEKALDDLERIIDDRGIAEVMMMLVHICDEKACHVEENWQDADLAKAWRRLSDNLISRQASDAINSLPDGHSYYSASPNVVFLRKREGAE
jgi:hypothetical protein